MFESGRGNYVVYYFYWICINREHGVDRSQSNDKSLYIYQWKIKQKQSQIAKTHSDREPTENRKLELPQPQSLYS